MRCPNPKKNPDCKRRFTRAKGSSRLYCEVCAPPKLRARKPGAPATVTGLPGAGQEAPEQAERVPGRLETATMAELVSVGRAESVEGAVALHLAELMDRGGHTGSQTASLSRELRSAVAAAVSGGTPVGDVLDDLQKQRAERIARTA
jgi:hypothetical protein